ncbi:MAG: Smr/MutS family protein [Pseudomonadota bacterium]
MSKRKRREIRPEERDLWQSYASDMKPLKRDRPLVGQPEDAPAAPPIASKSAKPPPRPVKSAASSKALGAANPAPRMDAKTFGRMRRGKLAPDGKIDLHGMHQDAAHAALTSFVLGRHAKGARLLLVITGKGKAGDDALWIERGILRRRVPEWLRLPPLGPIVLDVTEAHQRHGGSGAYYVYLKRSRLGPANA